MRKILIGILSICCSSFAAPTLTLINKTQSTLHFHLYEKTQEVFPDLTLSFDLENNDKITINHFNFDTYDSGYIHAEIDETKNAFFALDKDYVIHGYIGTGIAYSWDYNPATIIFCTPQEYQKHGRCV